MIADPEGPSFIVRTVEHRLLRRRVRDKRPGTDLLCSRVEQIFCLRPKQMLKRPSRPPVIAPGGVAAARSVGAGIHQTRMDQMPFVRGKALPSRIFVTADEAERLLARRRLVPIAR